MHNDLNRACRQPSARGIGFSSLACKYLFAALASATFGLTSPTLPLAASAPPPAPRLVIDGDLPTTGIVMLADLQSSPDATETTWPEHKVIHRVKGVPVWKILSAQGASPGPEGKSTPPAVKRSGWKMAVVATSADGYQAAFSLAELSPQIGATQALVAFEVDGKPLSPDRGPIRLVVPTDHEPARSTYQLERLTVIDLRKHVPSNAK